MPTPERVAARARLRKRVWLVASILGTVILALMVVFRLSR
jgi:hypothetical protein